VPLAEAGSKCRHPWMRDALQAWITRQGWQHVVPAANTAAAGAATAAGAAEQQLEQ
jgi:predicted transcriptional regulator